MKTNSVYAFFLVAFATAGLAQTPGNHAFPSNVAAHASAVAIETNRPLTLRELALNLNSSFQAVAQARDSKGFVHDRSALKQHTANLKAFGKTIKRMEHSAGESENGKLQNISRLLHDTKESFFAFEQANDQPNNPLIVVTMDVQESWAAHSRQLNQLTNAVEQAEGSPSQSTPSSTE